MTKSTAGDRVFRLIDGYDDTHFDLCRDHVDGLLKSSAAVVIHGAGQNGRMLAAKLTSAGIAVAAYCDDTPSKIGTKSAGIPILAPDRVREELGESAVVLVSIFGPTHDYVRTSARFRALGLATLSLFELSWYFAEESLPFYFLDHPRTIVQARDELGWLASQLIDAQSVAELCSHLEFRLSLRHDRLPIWTDNRLFPAGNEPFIYVDGGAFDGDTLVPLAATLGSRLAKGIAIEPDPANYDRLQRTIDTRLSHRAGDMIAVQAAIDATSGRRSLCSTGTQSSVLSDSGDERVDTVSIDDLLGDPSLPACGHLIKLDVEGAEEAAICGAEKTIRTSAPMLSVAIYHRPDDLWTIARRLAELQPRYRFALRSHGGDGADLMLYAIAD